MNRRTRTMIVVGVAVAMAGVASFGVFRAIQNIPERTKYIPAHYLVVAKQDVPVGTILEAQHVRLAGWPQDTTVEGSFAKIEDVLGRGATAQIVDQRADHRVASSRRRKRAADCRRRFRRACARCRSRSTTSSASPASQCPARASTCVVTIEAIASNSVSRAVLSNIQVLAAGTKFDQEQAKNGQPIPTAVVTLLVTPQDAEKHRAGADRGADHARAAQSARRRADGDAGRAHVGLLGAPAPAPVVKAVQGRPRTSSPPPPPPPPQPSTPSRRSGRRSEAKRSSRRDWRGWHVMSLSLAVRRSARLGGRGDRRARRDRARAVASPPISRLIRRRRRRRSPSRRRRRRQPTVQGAVPDRTDGRSDRAARGPIAAALDRVRHQGLLASPIRKSPTLVVKGPRELLINGKKRRHDQPDHLGRHARASITKSRSSNAASRRSSRRCSALFPGEDIRVTSPKAR